MKASSEYTKEIKSHLQNAENLQHSCKIYISTSTNNNWSFYFKKGGLVWCSSNNHRFRRLDRLVSKFCPEIDSQGIKLREQEVSELWEYLFLSVIYKRKQVEKEQVQEVIKGISQEVLFDCLIGEEKSYQIKVIFETKGNQMGAILNSKLLRDPLVYVKYSKFVYRIESQVGEWKNRDYDILSPNLAPVIRDIEKLKKMVDDFELYQKLFIFIDGKKTIRDLAVSTNQDLFTTTNHLLPHINSKAIALQEIPDRQLSNLYFSPSNQEVNSEYQQKNREYIRESDLPLVICIDSDPQVCQHITKLLNPIGYRVISVKDAAKTLIVLLENKPRLIFINADMPDASGYELCSQIRKMPILKSIPIVILNEQENIVNKFRRKMSGATDFLQKPLNSVEILTTAQKYTQNFVDRTITPSYNSD